mgnify:CR=1 FL=1
MGERGFFDLQLKLDKLRQRRQDEDASTTLAFQERLELGWLYHDNALEGVVLSHHEIKDALDDRILTDRRQGAMHRGIRAHKAAIDFVQKLGRAPDSQSPQHAPITVALLKQLHDLLIHEGQPKGSAYRSAKLPHRTYQHEIVQPDRIPLQMRELCDSLNEEPGTMHPLTRAASAHFDFMAIYPFNEHNGKVARLLMNLLLLRDGFPPTVIPDIERRRYYESLRSEKECLAELIADTLNTYCSAATHFIDDLAGFRGPHETH